MSHPAGIVASHAVAPLVDGRRQPLHILHGSRLAWQLADSHGHVICCVTFPGAHRLPHALGVDAPLDAASPLVVGAGALASGDTHLTVTRWWEPARPRWAGLRAQIPTEAAVHMVRSWRDRLGHGCGLTPYGDDVIVGSLVTLLAAGHSLSARWSAEIRAAPLEDLTTAASAGLLRQAAGGFCLDEVAEVLAAYAGAATPAATVRNGGRQADVMQGGGMHAGVMAGDVVQVAEQRLLAVGHSSGEGLLTGIRQMLGRGAPAPCVRGAIA